MTPRSATRPPTATRALALVRALVLAHLVALALAVLGPRPGAAAPPELFEPTDSLVGWPRDPVYVFYPRASCRGSEIELEVWHRPERKWVAHPAHARVPVETCQLEDAGVLWNELRWRCVEPPDAHVPAPSWVRGIDVFDPDVMERCAVSRDGDGFGAMTIDVASPSSQMPLRAAEPVATVEGSVRLGGLQGADYDVVIAIDTSADVGARGLLAAQVEAARAFVERARPRLGETRIGVVSHPNVRPRRGEHTGARTEIALTDDAAALDRALVALGARGAAGAPTFASGLAFALDALQFTGGDAAGARPHARKLLVMLADGTRALPFGPDAQQPANARAQVLGLARRAHEHGVALHLYALGGASSEPSTLVAEMLRDNRGRFTQVLRPDEARDYLRDIRMPYVTSISVRNETLGADADGLAYGTGGRFRGTVPVAFGHNRLHIEARSSDDEHAAVDHEFEFDGSLVKERLREAERQRLERMKRRREVTIEPEDGGGE
ncbi:MAG: VWA domain-containing protein [Myxococcota bacterium]